MYDGYSTIMTACSDGSKTTLNYTRGAGEVTYVSRFWIENYDPATGKSSWEQHMMNDTRSHGALRRLGSTLSMDVSITDGAGRWLADPYMILDPYENPEEVQSSCTTLYDGRTRCSETRTNVSGKKGSDASN